MLSSHGLKSALLKTAGRRAVASEQSGGGESDRYLLRCYSTGLLGATNPTRALSQLHALLVEGGDLRQLAARAKASLKASLADAVDSAVDSARAVGRRKPAPRTSAAELQPLYGQDGLFRAAVMYVLAHASRTFMTHLNATSVTGGEHMAAALTRTEGRPLITVCNHVASMDDPLVMSTILPPAVYADASQLRWTLCASDRCFHRELLVPFFRAAKVLPVERGAGMFQPGLAAAEERLRAGDWVHIFPEGTRSRDGRMGPVRKGVGRLVAACSEADPLILPFVHSGMEDVLPKGSLLPKAGREVRVLVGEPIDVADLLAASAKQGWPDDVLYSRIADRIGGSMAALKAALDGAPLDAAAQAALQQAALDQGLDLYDPVDNANRAASLLERVSFRMQHREWAVHGLARAKARLAAAVAGTASRAASWGGLEGALSGSGGEQQDAGVAARLQLQLQGLGSWLAPAAAGASGPAHEYSRQRSIAMLQLLQTRA